MPSTILPSELLLLTRIFAHSPLRFPIVTFGPHLFKILRYFPCRPG